VNNLFLSVFVTLLLGGEIRCQEAYPNEMEVAEVFVQTRVEVDAETQEQRVEVADANQDEDDQVEVLEEAVRVKDAVVEEDK